MPVSMRMLQLPACLLRVMLALSACHCWPCSITASANLLVHPAQRARVVALEEVMTKRHLALREPARALVQQVRKRVLRE